MSANMIGLATYEAALERIAQLERKLANAEQSRSHVAKAAEGYLDRAERAEAALKNQRPALGTKKYRIPGYNTHTSPEYQAWRGMKRRCKGSYAGDVPYYLKRGITVCERWSGPNSFVNFLADMGPRPSPQHSLDRIDNNGNYEPGNCRWATDAEQNNNVRSNKLYTKDGRTQTVSQWARELGVSREVVNSWRDRDWRKQKEQLATAGVK